MARTLIVTDPLALVAPPGPSNARQLAVEGDILMAEDAATNVLRLSGDSTSAQGGTLIVRGPNDYTFVQVLNFIRQ
jgi:hypothetical protein